MRLQTTALINRETTGRDVDKWMEDLFARIQLCILHPHSVIHQDGTATKEEVQVVEPGEIIVNTQFLDESPAAQAGGAADGLEQSAEQTHDRVVSVGHLPPIDPVRLLSNSLALRAEIVVGDSERTVSINGHV